MPNQTTNNRFSISSIRLICESAECGQLTDEAALFMSNLVTQKLKSLIETARKFSFHSKRKQLLNKDIDYALRALNMRPILGFYSKELIPFRFASGDGHKIYYYDDEFQPIELADVIARVNLPKLPQDVAIKSHWLAIDGIQPAIPENPPPLTKEEQQLECVDPLNSKNLLLWTAKTNVLKKHVETVQIKQLATHELSVEQQLYYKEITEACVNSDETNRHHALNSLAHDPGLHQMLPRLCVFISEGVKVNIVHNNLALIIYLMRMVKSMLDNPTLYLEKYLHELTPTVISCIVSKQICNRPEQENHYALRDFASKLLATICKNYNTSTNCLQTRITRLLCKALDGPKTPLSTVYGCISALCELGPEVKQALVVPRLQSIINRITREDEDDEDGKDKTRSSPSHMFQRSLEEKLDMISRTSPEGRIISLLEHHKIKLQDESQARLKQNRLQN